MYGFERLVDAGVKAEEAWDTAFWFHHYGNQNDFDRYISELENGNWAKEMETDG